jgi:hypothetical protein
MRDMLKVAAVMAAIGMPAAPNAPLAAQDLGARVAAVRDGRAQFTFAGREGICGDGRSYVRLNRNTMMGEWSDASRQRACEPGPVRVVAVVSGGRIEELRSYVGPVPAATGEVTDLGMVSAPAAARWLLSVARTADGRAATKAIMPAVLADSADVWRDLLAIARDTATRARSTRQDAAFWLSRFASAVVEGRKPGELPGDDDDLKDLTGDVEVKKSAVFALSQLRNHEGVPQLITVARTNKEPEVRQQALFWLGQSGDARGIALFEELLSRR